MAKKLHPADKYALEMIAQAEKFAAVMFTGYPRGYITEYHSTIDAAREAGKRLEKENPLCCRRAIIAAIAPTGASLPVPADYQPAA